MDSPLSGTSSYRPGQPLSSRILLSVNICMTPLLLIQRLRATISTNLGLMRPAPSVPICLAALPPKNAPDIGQTLMRIAVSVVQSTLLHIACRPATLLLLPANITKSLVGLTKSERRPRGHVTRLQAISSPTSGTRWRYPALFPHLMMVLVTESSTLMELVTIPRTPRLAAWSIVADPSPGIEHVQAAHAQLNWHIQETQVLECGRSSGPQTIGRAELLAIAIAIARVRNIRVVSDCKGAIDIAQALLAGRGIHNYANHPNFDIVFLLDQAIQKWPVEERVIHLEKIKSHQQGPFSLDDVRKVAGNEAADIAAKRTLADTPPDLRSLIHDARVFRTREKTLIPELLSGAYAAVVMYLQALRKDGKLPTSIRGRPVQPASDVVFLDTNPFFHFPADASWRQRACWGTTFTLAALKWLQMLKWPQDGCAAGQVTWIELLLSFKEQTGLAIPAPHPTVHGTFHSPGVHRVLHYEEKTLGAESWSFNNFMRSLRTIIGQEVLPWHKATNTIGTTPLFGVAVHAGGFNCRPNFPHQSKVRELLDAYFTKQVGRAHTGFVLRQSRTSPTVEEEDLILQPATIRANYMRYIKSRSKEKAQAKRDARALDHAA